MFIERIPAGIYEANCFLLGCEKEKVAAVIDPGGDAEKIMKKANDNGFEIKYIILTHGHGDHIGAVEKIRNKTKAEVLIHRDDKYLVENAEKNLSSLMSGPNVEFSPDKLLEDGDVIRLGELELNIIHTPGHTPGGICIKVEDVIFSGDTLFANSIGRTDFEGGSLKKLLNSIKNKVLIFDEETKVFPGHGPATTVGIEKSTNPFIIR